MLNRYTSLIIALIIGFIASWYLVANLKKSALTEEKGIEATYSCSEGKTIDAIYYNATSTKQVIPGAMPVPKGTVKVALSDGRVLTLPQTISASGVRYANSNESFVFWNKGNGAFVLENNTNKTYGDCIAVAKVSLESNLLQVYSNGDEGFSIRLPIGYLPDSSYLYQMDSQNSIGGVKFTIPAKLADGTNLGHDTYISVERLSNVKECSASAFLYDKTSAKLFIENGISYSVASSTGAGAGNRYEETVFAIPGTSPCLAVRYYIHYSVFENYPAGAVKEFDKQTILKQFDAIRNTLVFQ